MIELCLIGFFLSIRDDQGVFTGIGQVVVMMIATTSTVIYQLLLGNIFFSILKYLSVFPKDREDEGGESNLSYFSVSALDYLRYLGYICYGWIRPSKEVSRDLQESIDELARNKLDVTDRREYKHETTDYRSSVVWIPKNDFGISEDKIVYAKNYVFGIRISNDFADLNIKERITISQNISKTDIV